MIVVPESSDGTADNGISNAYDVVILTAKIFIACGVLWAGGLSMNKPRFSTGVMTALLGGVLSFGYLELLFQSVEMPLATVALYVLAIAAASVGLCLGVLLPLPFTGVCFGVCFATLLGFFLPLLYQDQIPLLSIGLALISALFSVRYNAWMLLLAASLETSAVAGSILFPNLFSSIVTVIRSEVFLPPSNGEDYDYISPTESERFLGICWGVSSMLILASLIYRKPAPLSIGNTTGGLNSRPQSISEPPSYYQPSPTALDAFNMFDPAFLPPRLAEYANMVYSACEDLGNFFGFQDSSVRNQAEHLLILLSNNRRYMNSHILPPSVQPPSPVHALHAKVFSNYMKWCRSMGIAPNFAKMSLAAVAAPPAVASRVVDLVLFFCVWGESCNVRHMPECMWFLYHKMMEDYNLFDTGPARSLYACHFIDRVICPIYDIVAKSMKSNTDHVNRRNYDDFNEFFWSRNCLKYHYSSDIGNLDDVENIPRYDGYNGRLPGEQIPSIIEGLESAPKTFLEKRSWFRGVLALHRILIWHLVTFYLLSVVAFSNELVWGWVYTVQVASGVFWIFNLLFISVELLEVWAAYPNTHLSGTAICGSIFSLSARFLVLVYQTMYLMWTFGPSTGDSKIYLGIEGDSNFWWWQYVWISLLCMIPWFIEVIFGFFPFMTTKVFTSQNDYVQSFLHILVPISRLYVGKEVHESFMHTAVYVFYWVTLMAWKLYFSYIFEVYSMVLPTLQLTDDYVNYPDQSFFKMSLLLTIRWLPQFLVYLIDMSIWYAVWQAFAGTAVGFSENLGDIRTMSDIRNNFSRAPENFCKVMLSPDAGSRRGSVASSMSLSQSFNSLGEEGQSLLGNDPHKLQSYVNRLLDVRVQKWVMFSAAWNEIIDHFRQEDIISNRERDNLKFSRFEGFSQAIYLPVFQTAGVIEDVLAELEAARDDQPSPFSDEQFFKPITSHNTMCTAVSEVWELGTFLFRKILGPAHHNDVVVMTSLVIKWAQDGTLLKHMDIEKLRSTMNCFIQLISLVENKIGRRKSALKVRKSSVPRKSAPSSIKRIKSTTSISVRSIEKPASKNAVSDREHAIVDALRDQVRDKIRSLVHSVKSLIKAVDVDSRDVLDRLTFLLSMENGFLWDDSYTSDHLDVLSKYSPFKEVLTMVHGLVACHPNDVEPKSKEVRRRLTFFVNSLFMDMPHAPSIHDMFSWNVMTPYYSEDVTYTKADLEKTNDELGVSTLLYLQTLYHSDWKNFIERLNIKDEEKVWSKKNLEQTRVWASIRAQTLSRTVSGMMYYEKALRLLANLERLDEDTTKALMGEKFGYIVSCQVYGNMKKNQDSKADDIEQLMHRYPHLRIAYIDSIRVNRAGAAISYSVLVKSDGHGGIQEIYRVRLPGNPVLGEGKPENQNHAMIFTRGEFLQTIDMNQEGYFEEALKMRNALQEFAKREGPLPTTILGLREHIFTGSVSSLANYMALQETSFVTLGQRVLTKPLRIRLHYGHPDVFDKLFFITRGGISKSSKGINLSEDIFAGYNNAIRGGQVAFKEYLQVGKGRDVGMSQIYKFEAKLSQGAGEQSLSRDVYRLCNRLDFCRLLSFYFGGIGHYFSNVLTVFTIYCVIYLMAVLAIFNLEKIGDRVITPMGTIQMLLGGLGLLQTIPLYATLGVERGWWLSLREIIHVFITGGPLHFMFHIQTKAYYMSQTILVGGAKYRATGRGFVTQHTAMDEQFRFFASSHLYLGIEMAAGLIIMGIFSDAGQYIGRTWSLWLASISFLFSPFWFNPLTFEWNVVVSDYNTFLDWMAGSSGGPLKSWSMWWVDENSFYKKMDFSSKLIYILKSAIYLLVANGIRVSELFEADETLHKPWLSIRNVISVIGGLVVISILYRSNHTFLPYAVRRTIGIICTVGLMAGILILFLEDSNFVRYSMAAYYGVGALCQLGLLAGIKSTKHFYFIHDMVCGHVIFFFLFIFGALQFVHYIQTWLLYHNALSSDVVVGNILRYARKNQQAGSAEGEDDLAGQVAELKKIVQKQEEMIQATGVVNTSSLGNRSSSTDAIAKLVTPNPSNGGLGIIPSIPARGRERMHQSMTGMDVWGSIAAIDDKNGAGKQSNDERKSQSDFDFVSPVIMPPR